jgi:hypothetical protein
LHGGGSFKIYKYYIKAEQEQHLIYFNAVVESGIMGAVGNWKLKVHLVEAFGRRTFSVEYMNIMVVATQEAGTAMVCFETL